MYVRIKDPATQHEISVTEAWANLHDLTPMDKPAEDSSGRPLPPKYHRTINEVAAATKKGA